MTHESRPFKPGISPKEYRETMRKIEECERRVSE
jgi:hypothetical protein